MKTFYLLTKIAKTHRPINKNDSSEFSMVVNFRVLVAQT